MDNQLLLALIAGFSISIIAGILGCFVIWRRMAYFGDSMSHSALLGLALGIFFNINSDFSIILVAFIFAMLLFYLQKRDLLPVDSLLGILAHGSLALAMVLMSFVKGPEIDLETLLFGDILAVNLTQIYVLLISLAVILPILIYNWQKLLLYSISKDLALLKSKGAGLEILFVLIFALTVAVSIKIIGALLITSVLIIPAAAARQVSDSVPRMVFSSVFISALSCFAGVLLAYKLGVLAAPMIVLVLIMMLILCLSLRVRLSF